MRKKYCLLILFFVQGLMGKSQTILPGAETQELIRIMNVYANMPNLSFDLKYTYADSLTWQDIVDSMAFSCKLSYNTSLVSNDEMEFLQGKNYSVYVDKIDSIIMTGPLPQADAVFQVPLLDTNFRKGHVTGMHIDESTDTLWVFTATFKPESPYLYYEMKYNPQSGLVQSVNFHVRNEQGAHDIPADHIICATIYMNNYSFSSFDPALLNENRYFYSLNGALYLQPAWAQYHFQNQ